MHESITQIPKTILQKSNSNDGLDARIDRTIWRIDKWSDIFTSMSIFGPNKTNFINTGWSVEGLGWIIIQPIDDEE